MKKWQKVLGILATSVVVLSLTACGKVIYIGNTNSGKQINKVLNQTNFSNLIINSESSDVVIKTGKNYSVRYKGGEKVKPSVENKDGQLIIKQKSGSNSNSTVTITVPKGVELSQIDLKSEAGDITLEDLKVQNVQINAEEGDIDFKQTSLNNGQINAEEGDINLTQITAKAGTTIKSEQGDVTVADSNFKGYDFATEEGSINIKGHSYASSSYKQKAHAKNVLRVKSEEGDITVK